MSAASLPPIPVALVEDAPAVRASLEKLIHQTPGFRLAGAWSNAESAIEHLPPIHPEVVLVDIQLPGLDGIECVRSLKPVLPHAEFLMFTVFDEHRGAYESIKAGASGYLIKHIAPERLIEAIREVRDGGSVMSPIIARWVLDDLRARAHTVSRDEEALSFREEEVLERIAQGYRFKEIAGQLGVTFHTVRSHVSKIYTKLQVHSKTQAIRRFRERQDSRWNGGRRIG